jgi:hypothetical protein
LKAYTVSRNGRLNVWECDTSLSGLVEKTDELLNDEEYENDGKTNGEANKYENEADDEKTISKIGVKYMKKAK